jgi:hypothetical protein
MSTLALLASGVIVSGQRLSREPVHETGQSVTGAYEGWFPNPDGSFSMLFGYFNRSAKQELDVPIGPNNRIEPGGPDRGQPTHFLTGRQYGLFVVRVPADFDKAGKIVWTLVANGQTTSIPGTLKTDYQVSPFKEAAVGNTPPVVRFEENGPSVQGPLAMTVERTAQVGSPLTLLVWPSDDAKLTTGNGARPAKLGLPVSLRWIKYRGAGTVTFGKPRPDVEKLQGGEEGQPFRGKSTTTATFSEAGDYELALIANDYSGDGGAGFQCCWTTAHVKVSVKP